MSLQLPEYFKELLEQQAAYASRKAWWLCQKPSPRPSLAQTNPQKEGVGLEGPALFRLPHTPTTLQEDLFNAISSPLTPQAEVPLMVAEPVPPIKTSQSHPLKYVFVIVHNLHS